METRLNSTKAVMAPATANRIRPRKARGKERPDGGHFVPGEDSTAAARTGAPAACFQSAADRLDFRRHRGHRRRQDAEMVVVCVHSERDAFDGAVGADHLSHVHWR